MNTSLINSFFFPVKGRDFLHPRDLQAHATVEKGIENMHLGLEGLLQIFKDIPDATRMKNKREKKLCIKSEP